jgi:hypothetical protein
VLNAQVGSGDADVTAHLRNYTLPRIQSICRVAQEPTGNLNGIGTLLPPPESHQKTKVQYDLTKGS